MKNTYVKCADWSWEDKLLYIKACVGEDIPHDKICGYAYYSKDQLLEKYKNGAAYIYCHSDGMISFDKADTGTSLSLKRNTEIKLSDLKPRTKTEFVKCEYSREWKAVRHYNEVGELFVVDCNGNYTNVNDISGAWYEVVCKNYKELYIKVETEIDERQEFINTYASLRHEFHGQRTYDDFSGFMYDSGKFKLVE